MANFPANLDSAIHPGPGTFMDDAGFELDLLVSDLMDRTVALETKLGIGASVAASGSVLRATAAGASQFAAIQKGDLAVGAGQVLIGRVLLASPAASMAWVQIPTTYHALILRWNVLSLAAGTLTDTVVARFSVDSGASPNPDASANYCFVYLSGNNNVAASTGSYLLSYAHVGVCGGATSNQYFSAGQLVLNEYANTPTKGWIAQSQHQAQTNAAATIVYAHGGDYHGSGAVRQVWLGTLSGSNFAAGSSAEVWAA